MVHAIRIHQAGGPEVMKWESVEVRRPGPGAGAAQAACASASTTSTSISARASTRCRLPFVAGSEGAGEVVAVGPGVTDFKVGDRGAYAGALGGYAEERVMPADRLVKLPDSIDYKTGGGHDAAGHDGALPAAPDLQGRPGHHAAVARGGRRHRPHRLPVGAPPRRHHHRHRQHAGQGRARQGARLHARHQLQDRGLREAHQGAHQRPGRRRRLRRGRQGHLPGLARLPEAAGPVGQLRQRLGRDHQLRHPARCRPRARSTPRGRRSAPTSPSARTCSPMPASCSTWSARASSRSTSTTPIR